MSYALRMEEPNSIIVACVLVICVGTCVAARGDLAISTWGVALQLAANAAEACRVVLSQRLLSGSGAAVQLPLVEMQHHVAPMQVGSRVIV